MSKATRDRRQFGIDRRLMKIADDRYFIAERQASFQQIEERFVRGAKEEAIALAKKAGMVGLVMLMEDPDYSADVREILRNGACSGSRQLRRMNRQERRLRAV